MYARVTLAASLLMLVTAAAFAHTGLRSSTPAAGATLEGPIDAIVLEFAEPVRLTAITLTDAAGREQPLGARAEAAAAAFTLATGAPLPPGAYVIAWRAVGADTHVVSGEIPFTITAAAHAH
jgi:hypothetical protein